MNETHDLKRQPNIDPDPAMMPAAEGAAYSNGFEAGQEGAQAEITRLRTELADESSGTPLGRLNAIAEAAKERGLCTGTEAKPAEVFLIEAFDALRAELHQVALQGEASQRQWAEDRKELNAKSAEIVELQTELHRLRPIAAQVDDLGTALAEAERRLSEDYTKSAMDQLRATAHQDAETIARLQKCLHFFASVIKCGESWTDTCERDYRGAVSLGPFLTEAAFSSK